MSVVDNLRNGRVVQAWIHVVVKPEQVLCLAPRTNVPGQIHGGLVRTSALTEASPIVTMKPVIPTVFLARHSRIARRRLVKELFRLPREVDRSLDDGRPIAVVHQAMAAAPVRAGVGQRGVVAFAQLCLQPLECSVACLQRSEAACGRLEACWRLRPTRCRAAWRCSQNNAADERGALHGDKESDPDLLQALTSRHPGHRLHNLDLRTPAILCRAETSTGKAL
mmetsp:Transcript_77120/g.200562  ORF Transcript_77120/g.200562 Transcript_77120/m.200562 type:complete len:223 (-) Transcript_77120:128-796(-)